MFYETEWDMTNSLAEIEKNALEKAEYAINKRRKDVQNAWKTILLIVKIAEEEGLLALEDKLKTIRQIKAPYYKLLESLLILLVDGTEANLIYEVMTNDYYTREHDAGTDFIFFLYQLCVKDILESIRYGCPDPKPLSEILEHYMIYIPSQYYQEFYEILQTYL